jgi:hypothetical protein
MFVYVVVAWVMTPGWSGWWGKMQHVPPERRCPPTRLQHGVSTPKNRIRVFTIMETSCHAFVLKLKYHGV